MVIAIIFDWDEGNKMKSTTKHGISNIEAESAFMDGKKLIVFDKKHSGDEMRFYCIGRSLEDRILLITFTTRNTKIRIISARKANEKEKKQYLSR